MAYSTGNFITIGSWKTELMDNLWTLLTALSWTRDENAYADGTYTRWVFTSPAADFSVMFFCATTGLSVSTSTTAGTGGGYLYANILETYSAGSHNGTKPAVLNTTTTFACAGSGDTTLGAGTYTPTGLVGAATPGMLIINSTGNNTVGTAQAATSGSYHINAYSDQILLGVRFDNGGNGGTVSNQGWQNTIVAGKFTSAVVTPGTNDPTPIGIFAINRGGTTHFGSSVLSGGVGSTSAGVSIYGGYTRSALNASSAAHLWSCNLVGITSTLNRGTSSSATWDLWQGAVGPTMSQVGINRNTGTAINGAFRGILPRVLLGYAAVPVWGDLVTNGSDTYVICTAGNGSSDNFWIKRS